MEELKFCINCRHFVQPPASISACHAPQNIKLDPVTGEHRAAQLPSFMRACSLGCGEAALWFEPKEGTDAAV